MAFDAAQIFRQTIATTQFDTRTAEETRQAAPAGESGVAMGFGVHVETNPLADLMDSMEELSFQFEEKEAKDVSERKLGSEKSRSNAYIEAVQKWQKAMPDMPGAEFLQRMLRQLRMAQYRPDAGELLKWLGQGSDDPSHQFAMLDCLENALRSGEEELTQLVQNAKAQLEREQGPAMRAGLNIAEEINQRVATPEEMRDLREMYRGETIGFTTPQQCFRSLLASRGAGRLTEAIDFLIAAAGVDLHSPSPSQSPEELRRIILDLQCVEVVRTVMDKLDALVARMDKQFNEQCLLNGEKLTGRVVDLTEKSFVNSAQVGSLITSCGIQALLAQTDFASGLLAVFRSLSPRLFENPQDRFKLTAAGQELLESLTDRLEDEEAAEEEQKKKKQEGKQ